MNDVQKALAQLREKGWTLASIGDELDIPPNTVRKWSAGMHYPANAPAVKASLGKLLVRKRVPKQRGKARSVRAKDAPMYDPQHLKEAIRKGRGMLKHLTRGESVVDEFLSERRAEASRE